MKTLDLDVGNSRLKWRLLGEREESEGVVPRSDAPLDAISAEGVDRVRVSSVVGAGSDALLREAVLSRFGVQAEFAHTTRAIGGVTCGYQDPTTFGVDRWLALIAAWHRGRTDTVVIDCGTAATVDFVTAAGQHLGGYIVPGVRLMAESLFRDTADVNVPDVAMQSGIGPGRTTIEAVQRGVVRMLADFLDRSVARFQQQCDDRAHLFVCGGDADIIAPHLTTSVVAVPGLVLDGLAIALP